MSRALGDREYKGDVHSDIWAYPAGHSKQFTADLVLSEPMTTTETLDPETDEFLILACDGLWDVMNGENAVRIAQDRLQHGYTPKVRATFCVLNVFHVKVSVGSHTQNDVCSCSAHSKRPNSLLTKQ